MRPTSVESASSSPSISYSGLIISIRPGRIGIQLGLAVQDKLLPGLESFFEILPVKKFAGERARLVADQQVINAAARARVADQAAAQDLRAHGVDAAGRDRREFLRSGCGLRSGRANSREGLQTSAARVAPGVPRGAAPRLSGTSARLQASRPFLVYITQQWNRLQPVGFQSLQG